MADMDLLVEKNGLEKVHKLMNKNGFVSLTTDPSSFQRSMPTYRKNYFPPIGMHYKISGLPFSKLMNISESWDRARIDNFHGVDVLTLNPEDLLLHLCVHTSFQHRCRFNERLDLAKKF